MELITRICRKRVLRNIGLLLMTVIMEGTQEGFEWESLLSTISYNTKLILKRNLFVIKGPSCSLKQFCRLILEIKVQQFF